MPNSEVAYLNFTSQQCQALIHASQCLADAGGPEAKGVATQARAFAGNINRTNQGKQVRLVGNFKGGGCLPLLDERPDTAIEISSHAGIGQGPHTEAPYNCSTDACNGHSPAPSALILSARWNPAAEPTYVFPVRHIIEQLNSRTLHGRDAFRDNRRLLVRQFGYAPFATPLVLAEDPLLVRG